MKARKSVLTDQELEIMKIVWQLGTATVREVYEELLKSRKIAYTTVMTMMGILEQKGRLTKTTRDRAYVYSPAEPQGLVVGNMVHDFVKRVFDGSAKPLLVHLAEKKKISQKELDEISDLLKKRRRK
ncbi:MAG: CopY family transcriptional regulator [Acidobacteria bacterium]|nr:MAG: CopY family transcriptional regulator [Acidobacteriota bacterium]